MPRDPRLQIITEAIERLVPGAAPARMTVEIAEGLLSGGRNVWSGDPDALALKVYTALYGRPRDTDDRSPRDRAEDAKKARDLVGELSALTDADAELTSAPWHPLRPGDLVHVHYEQTGAFPAFGETYIVGDAGPTLLSLQLLAHTLPEDDPSEAAAMAGCFASDASDDPIYDMWFEAGPHRLTVVRDGRPVHVGGAR